MTTKQSAVVERVRNTIVSNFPISNGEIKEFEVQEHKHFVSLVAEVGKVGDEKTWGSILNRYSIQIFIGKNGGITYPVSLKFKNGKYKFIIRRVTRTNDWYRWMFKVYYAQRYNV